MYNTTTFKVVCVDHASREMIVEEDHHKKIKNIASPQEPTLVANAPNHVVLTYAPYQNTIHPHIGDKVSFFTEGSLLEYQPTPGEYSVTNEDVVFSNESRHKLFMWDDRLVFCQALHASKVSECLKVIDLQSGTTGTPLCTELSCVRPNTTMCYTPMYAPSGASKKIAASKGQTGPGMSKMTSKKHGKTDATDFEHINVEYPITHM